MNSRTGARYCAPAEYRGLNQRNPVMKMVTTVAVMSTGSGREKGTFFVHGNPGLIEILKMEARRAIVIHLLLGQHSHNKLVKSCLQNKG